MTAAPSPGRPQLFGREPSGPALPWAWADEQLRAARTYWVATVGPSLRPHTRPYWGCWAAGVFRFSTGSRALDNVRGNPQASVHLESGTDVVVVEGRAGVVAGPAELAAFVAQYNCKYGWDLEVRGDLVGDARGASGHVVRVAADVVYGWRQSVETATRWRFTG